MLSIIDKFLWGENKTYKKEYKTELNQQSKILLLSTIITLIIGIFFLLKKEMKERKEKKEQILINELRSTMNSIEHALETGARVDDLKGKMIEIKHQIINLN